MASLTSTTPDQELIAPESGEHEALGALSKLLGRDEQTPLRLVAADGSEIELPGSARHVLIHAVAGLSKQQLVSIKPVDPNLSVKQVEALLGSTDSYVAKILETGELPSTIVNGRRLIDIRDAMEFRRVMRKRHEEGLIELVRISEEMGLYDQELTE
ncbi:MAG: hypothetical protein M3439_08165 [Chloroflexota bacterium]|nr:hypothetical protein [Chloroflexota bacterium]